MATHSTALQHPTLRRGYALPLAIVAALAVAAVSWFYTSILQTPQPRLCGSPGGPPVTATRILLRDGRFLAYLETGVPRSEAKHKFVFAHGFGGSRFMKLQPSTELMEELGVYMVSYDRAGYGESDPNPRRSVRSEVMDIEELADTLELGSRFYVMGNSLGGHAVWGSLKYIPHRLAGAVLLAPVMNYRWLGFPKNLSAQAYYQQDIGDQWTMRVSYYAPWLLNWWMSQSWLPTSTVIKGTTSLPNQLDAEFIRQLRSNKEKKIATQQGVGESLYRDIKVMFGRWEFDPMELPPASVPVHLWQGDEDGLVPVTLQQYICYRLDWIQYHELPRTGHVLVRIPGFGDLVLKTLLLQS